MSRAHQGDHMARQRLRGLNAMAEHSISSLTPYGHAQKFSMAGYIALEYCERLGHDVNKEANASTRIKSLRKLSSTNKLQLYAPWRQL